MRLDHYALRVKDRNRAAGFYESAFGYKVQEEFDLDFGNGQSARCLALSPPEKLAEHDVRTSNAYLSAPGVTAYDINFPVYHDKVMIHPQPMHLAPDIFISDGTDGSVVGKWVDENGPGIHHIAYEVEDVQATMDKWRAMMWADFTTEKVLECPGLWQAFTKVHPVAGLTYEFIKREKVGFCKDNVRNLMISSDNK